MSLLTDDQDIRHVRMNVELGGNGDYYVTLYEFGKTMFNREGELENQNTYIGIRVSTSGGNAPTEVKLAVVNLYRALEAAGLNKNPFTEENI